MKFYKQLEEAELIGTITYYYKQSGKYLIRLTPILGTLDKSYYYDFHQKKLDNYTEITEQEFNDALLEYVADIKAI